jgi:superfamily I DNA and/or RNA helicase
MLFISVESQEARETNGFSFCNPIEAQICVEYINFLITNKGVLARNIAVISPYKFQHRCIIGLMNKRHNRRDFGDVLVNSVEGLQVSTPLTLSILLYF